MSFQGGRDRIGFWMISPDNKVITEQYDFANYLIKPVFRQSVCLVPVGETLLKQIESKFINVLLQEPDASHGLWC